jgi:carboxymethylenebutenolidase
MLRRSNHVLICKSGAYSLMPARTYAKRVVATASFYGTRLATDTPDSLYLRAPEMHGDIYVGESDVAPYIATEEADGLETALKEVGTNHTVEIYPGVHHRFAVLGLAIYDRDAWGRHWERLLALFERNLPTDCRNQYFS